MKKLYFLLMVATISITASAQMPKLACATNLFAMDSTIVPGLMVFTIHRVKPESPVVISTTTIAEKFSGKRNESVLQTYGGVGLANKANTLTCGIDVGVVVHDFKEVEPSYSVWGYAQTNNGKWQLWFIHMKEGYFVEFWRCLDFVNTKRCENFFGITNFEGSFAPTWKMYFPRKNLYAFVGYAIKVYEEEKTSHGIEYSTPRKPLRQPGLHLEIGYEIPHGKKKCEECN